MNYLVDTERCEITMVSVAVRSLTEIANVLHIQQFNQVLYPLAEKCFSKDNLVYQTTAENITVDLMEGMRLKNIKNKDNVMIYK